MKPNEVMIGIPGVWENFKDLKCLLNKLTGGYNFIEDKMFKESTKLIFNVIWSDREDNLIEQLSFLGRGKFTKEDLKDIDRHTVVVYVWLEISSLSDVTNLINIGKDLLDVGGLAIKIQTSGIAYRKDDWITFSNQNLSEDSLDIFDYLSTIFVNMINNGYYYESIGMKFFGYPDVIMNIEEVQNEACEVMNVFNEFQVFSKTDLISGMLFSITEDSQKYHLFRVFDDRYNLNDARTNPYGLWILERV